MRAQGGKSCRERKKMSIAIPTHPFSTIIILDRTIFSGSVAMVSLRASLVSVDSGR